MMEAEQVANTLLTSDIGVSAVFLSEFDLPPQMTAADLSRTLRGLQFSIQGVSREYMTLLFNRKKDSKKAKQRIAREHRVDAEYGRDPSYLIIPLDWSSIEG